MKAADNVLSQRLLEVADLLGSQSTLAKVVDKDRSTVNRWIHGTAEPNLGSLIAISQATGLSVDYLLGLSEMRMVKKADVEQYDLVLAIKNVAHMTQNRHVFIRGTKIITVEAGDVSSQHREG
jgi:transcriptional regulator with XRE-family HTH domain